MGKTASERISKSIFNIIIDFHSLHKNTNFRPEIAARNCGFCSIASVGAQIYGFVSSDAHAASGRKPLFAACLRCDRPVGGRNYINSLNYIFSSFPRAGKFKMRTALSTMRLRSGYWSKKTDGIVPSVFLELMAGLEPATCSLRVNRTTCCATLAGGAYAPKNI